MLCMGLMMCLLSIPGQFPDMCLATLFAFTEEIIVILFILSVYIGAIGGNLLDSTLKIEILTIFKQKGANCLVRFFQISETSW